jgi:hypothetical protein
MTILTPYEDQPRIDVQLKFSHDAYLYAEPKSILFAKANASACQEVVIGRTVTAERPLTLDRIDVDDPDAMTVTAKGQDDAGRILITMEPRFAILGEQAYRAGEVSIWVQGEDQPISIPYVLLDG